MSGNKTYKIFLGLSLVLIVLVALISFILVPKVPSINFISFRGEEKIDEQPKLQINEAEDTFTVTKVVDGDTIKIDYYGKPETIRLIGLDAPEIDGDSNTCFAEESKNFLTTFVLDKKVRLESDERVTDRDKYNRLLRYVHLENTNINLELIRQGYAEEVTYTVGYKYNEEFKNAQLEAFNDNLGVWSVYCGDE